MRPLKTWQIECSNYQLRFSKFTWWFYVLSSFQVHLSWMFSLWSKTICCKPTLTTNEDVTDKIKSCYQNNKAIYDKTEETLEKFCVKLMSFFLTQDSQCESVAHNAGSQVVNQKSIELNVWLNWINRWKIWWWKSNQLTNKFHRCLP